MHNFCPSVSLCKVEGSLLKSFLPLKFSVEVFPTTTMFYLPVHFMNFNLAMYVTTTLQLMKYSWLFSARFTRSLHQTSFRSFSSSSSTSCCLSSLGLQIPYSFSPVVYVINQYFFFLMDDNLK